MRKRVAREWLLVMILVIVAAFTFLTIGCNYTSKTEQQLREDLIVGREDYYKEHFIEIEYKGHTYIYYSRWERMGLTHAGHCEGDHR